jgi:hypothetical protein
VHVLQVRTLCRILRGDLDRTALNAVDVIAHDLTDGRQAMRFIGQDDPGRKASCTTTIEGIEHDIDEIAHLTFARAQTHDGRFDRRRELADHLTHQLGLQPRRRAEVMNQIRVTHPKIRRNRLQRDGIGTFGEQETPR